MSGVGAARARELVRAVAAYCGVDESWLTIALACDCAPYHREVATQGWIFDSQRCAHWHVAQKVYHRRNNAPPVEQELAGAVMSAVHASRMPDPETRGIEHVRRALEMAIAEHLRRHAVTVLLSPGDARDDQDGAYTLAAQIAAELASERPV